MANPWYKKAAVQAAIAAGLFLVFVTVLTLVFQSKRPTGNVTTIGVSNATNVNIKNNSDNPNINVKSITAS